MLNHVEQLLSSFSHFVKMPMWFWYECPSLFNPLVQFQHVSSIHITLVIGIEFGLEWFKIKKRSTLFIPSLP